MSSLPKKNWEQFSDRWRREYFNFRKNYSHNVSNLHKLINCLIPDIFSIQPIPVKPKTRLFLTKDASLLKIFTKLLQLKTKNLQKFTHISLSSLFSVISIESLQLIQMSCLQISQRRGALKNHVWHRAQDGRILFLTITPRFL